MFDMNLVATMAMAVGLVGGAALALWQLPWSEAEVRAANADLKATFLRPAPREEARRALRFAFR